MAGFWSSALAWALWVKKSARPAANSTGRGLSHLEKPMALSPKRALKGAQNYR
jgi:hypothetical protein